MKTKHRNSIRNLLCLRKRLQSSTSHYYSHLLPFVMAKQCWYCWYWKCNSRIVLYGPPWFSVIAFTSLTQCVFACIFVHSCCLPACSSVWLDNCLSPTSSRSDSVWLLMSVLHHTAAVLYPISVGKNPHEQKLWDSEKPCSRTLQHVNCNSSINVQLCLFPFQSPTTQRPESSFCM